VFNDFSSERRGCVRGFQHGRRGCVLKHLNYQLLAFFSYGEEVCVEKLPVTTYSVDYGKGFQLWKGVF
jgi:hypothetical protein